MQLINDVAAARKARGWTQEALAERVGVTRRTIISLEKGHYTPSLTLGLMIATALQVPVADLFRLEE
ncbi:helix-turn-helix transcriptional regulator [Lacticaseibacillus absianus]|uniref:helix-turn-helix transcriptional regulator n=1 Tax=Lacticaseibacillus absianus TaxID=2729623 RepID=UPI0015CBF582|nr:helix-turn-helix transcriptional regulator [Lacticaseibacillus absianus]